MREPNGRLGGKGTLRMDEEMFGEVVVAEPSFRDLQRIGGDESTLVLENEEGVDVDGDEMASWFRGLPGIDRVKSLVLGPTSRLRDVRVVKGLPRLENLQVNGLRLASLDGLEELRHGQYLNLDTGRNKRRSIAELSRAPLRKLTLQFARDEDLDAIASNRTLRHLELGGSPQSPFKRWTSVPLEFVGLSRCSFKELADTAEITSLTKMTLIRCKSLERLAGDHSRLSWLAIHACAKLDLQTLATLRGLESLFVVDNRKDCPLSAFAGLARLKILSLEACKVKLDLDDLDGALPALEELHILGLDDRKALQLSRLNPAISVFTGIRTYQNGTALK